MVIKILWVIFALVCILLLLRILPLGLGHGRLLGELMRTIT